ncbi:MAG: VPLPA-CTERM-specific exosortase XrtD [Terriglobales bacterium]
MGHSVEIAPLAPAGEESRVLTGLLRYQGWLLLLLVGWLYHSILYNLGLQWSHDPNFQHGWFVPAFSFYLLWQDRKRLKAIEVAPSWAGLPLVVLGLVMLSAGVLGIEFFTSRASLLVLLAGLIILFRGWEFLRAIFFPLAFLVLMIPLPNLILQKFTFPLQLLASKLATAMLEIVGVPVLREGNTITLAKKQLEVAEACSGIRSLYSLVTLSIIYGYLMEKRNWVRVTLACAAVPIAVLANSFRIFGTGLIVQFWDPTKADGFYHEFQGWLVFVVALILLFGFHRLINLIWGPPPDDSVKPAHVDTRRASAKPATKLASRFLAAALLMMITASYLWVRGQDEIFPPRQPLSSIPMQINGWNGVGTTLDQQTLDILGNPEYILRDYVDPSQSGSWINLFIAYYATQKAGETPHTPAHCLPGAGWTPTKREVIAFRRPDGSSFPANRFVIAKGGERQLVIYWFQAQGLEVASEYRLKYYLVANSIRLHRSDGALIRIMTPMDEGESADAAQARVMQGIGNALLPQLPTYIPR